MTPCAVILARAELSQGRDEGVLFVEDWAEIRRLYRSERMPIKVIARVVGCSKNTVKSALASEGPPRGVVNLVRPSSEWDDRWVDLGGEGAG